jgi:hypothetical protein
VEFTGVGGGGYRLDLDNLDEVVEAAEVADVAGVEP